jgi:hypothetical protein
MVGSSKPTRAPWRPRVVTVLSRAGCHALRAGPPCQEGESEVPHAWTDRQAQPSQPGHTAAVEASQDAAGHSPVGSLYGTVAPGRLGARRLRARSCDLRRTGDAHRARCPGRRDRGGAGTHRDPAPVRHRGRRLVRRQHPGHDRPIGAGPGLGTIDAWTLTTAGTSRSDRRAVVVLMPLYDNGEASGAAAPSHSSHWYTRSPPLH